jgi:thioredoxin 1
METFTNDNFQTEVIESKLPVLVDFYAEWCGPCKIMEPLISDLGEEFVNRCKVGRCNTEEEVSLTERYNIVSIPTIIIFVEGKEVERIHGTLSKVELTERVEKFLGYNVWEKFKEMLELNK